MGKYKKILVLLLTVFLLIGSFAGLAIAAEKTGWVKKETTITKEKKWYYICSDGTMAEGWKKIDGYWYAFWGRKFFPVGITTGGPVNNYRGSMFSEITVAFWEGGTAASGDAYFYSFDKSGKMLTGWVKTDGDYFNDYGKSEWMYHDSKTGKAVDNWQKIKGKWYYFSPRNLEFNNTWGPAGANRLSGCIMQTGWLKDGSCWYYLKPDGAMVTGWQKIDGSWYYLKSGGAMATGWQKIKGKWYYFGKNGKMVTGEQKIKGKTYTFNSSGVWIK